ncbi:type I toxin-antitoxin system ptaRNA1 family toxin [Burkholderia pseudomallei]|uniref:Toxin of toxin-antitoxin type 1 system n=3 Tax=Burkholderia pseudomallei TaxID=28450 RepID=Q63PW1_BURPS|nr:type I toxin-antitoxin system ptaRNA1 family toxin [Burkholderia pseudomallei]HDR9024063.1 type I toxin-antitoxin system ptaRNA1 family toxin [Burkholderia vietnamiensis]AJX27822.1 toxin of toxin-antitoxin type 1 system family protein [Burkholderia pseudomallei K96243]MBD2921915.1 type I toxin-antitoxin system ptaRNA1 family toxin [Burkholderia pseudomallei]MBD3001817.1 type I toxin-antitoxin system ptaRNA1 family toxin [Burkholderia pseudomallei]MDE3327367.1 type I toxin-antitoxin system p
MATMHDTEAREVIHHTAMQLAALEFIDPHAAKDLSEMTEAMVNLFVVVFYQAETGRATRSDFREAMTAVRQALLQYAEQLKCHGGISGKGANEAWS